jgi:hypothetical protein
MIMLRSNVPAVEIQRRISSLPKLKPTEFKATRRATSFTFAKLDGAISIACDNTPDEDYRLTQYALATQTREVVWDIHNGTSNMTRFAILEAIEELP